MSNRNSSKSKKDLGALIRVFSRKAALSLLVWKKSTAVHNALISRSLVQALKVLRAQRPFFLVFLGTTPFAELSASLSSNRFGFSPRDNDLRCFLGFGPQKFSSKSLNHSSIAREKGLKSLGSALLNPSSICSTSDIEIDIVIFCLLLLLLTQIAS